MNVSLDLEWTDGCPPSAGDHQVDVITTAEDMAGRVINVTVEGLLDVVMAWLLDEYCLNDVSRFLEVTRWLTPEDFRELAPVG